jgi:hypothetical protein
MMNFNQIALELAQSRQDELIAESLRSRRVANSRPSIRQSVGRRVIAVGERIAAESYLELAQSR